MNTEQNDTIQSEVLFENTHFRNKEVFKEVYSNTFLKSPLIIISLILMSLFELQLIFSVILDGSTPDLLLFLFLPLFFCSMLYFSYRRTVKVAVAREQEQNPSESFCYTIRVTDTQLIHTISNGSEVTFDFDSIEKTFVTKHFHILQSKANTLLFFRKDGFTKGTYEEFCAFLETKDL